MNIIELSDLIVGVLDDHCPAISGDCTCGSPVDHGGDIHLMYRHQADKIIIAILQQGTGIAPNEAYSATDVRQGYGNRPMIENPEVLAGRAVAPTMIPNPDL